MTDAITLSPCPFCGGRPYLANVAMAGCSYVVCTDCRIQSDDGMKDRVIEKWNARTPPKVKPLDMPERRNGYWGHKSGYQVAHTNGDLFRVRFHGRVICKNIKGFSRAVDWANADHELRILEVLA